VREFVPVVVPWLVMFSALSVSYLVEARFMRSRRAPGDSGPSVALSTLATVLLGPLIAPIYFWKSRLKPSGLLLGLGVTAASVGLYYVVALASRGWLASNVLARAHAACMVQGPLAADPDAAKSEGPCAAVVEAYEAGRGCVVGTALVSCQTPGATPFAVEPSSDRARALLEHRCTSRNELGACIALGERAADDAQRSVAAAKVRKVCCKWWENGVCERFTSPDQCSR
jgi:hypothetical protein